MGCTSCHPTGKIEQRYKIIKDLGEGGIGKVIQLKDDKNNSYALKMIKIVDLNEEEKKERKENWKNETKILEHLKRFNNKHIIKLIEANDLEEDYLRILMEYGGDCNLKKFIKEKNGILMDEKVITNIIEQICDGLKGMHKYRVIHRDLTPENIFINTKNNMIKIGDFDVSTQLKKKQKFTEGKIGKVGYIAPEVENEEKYDYRADIYTLGCLIYELFTLKEYYAENSGKNSNKGNNIDLYKNYNQKWSNLIESLLSKDKDSRPYIEDLIKSIKNIRNNYDEIILKIKINDPEEICLLNKESQIYKKMNKANSALFINKKKVKLANKFTFKNKGETTIKYILKFSVEDCSNMFKDCSNITSIDLSYLNTKNVVDMSNMFKNCNELSYVNLSNLNTEKVTNMSNMFNNCNKLKFIDLPKLNTENVTDMSNMFSYCSKLKKINNISNFNTIKVTTLESMFKECKNLEKIDLTSFDTNKVKDMSYMFYKCENIRYIHLSNFNIAKTTKIDKMFDESPNQMINIFAKAECIQILENEFKSKNIEWIENKEVKD